MGAMLRRFVSNYRFRSTTATSATTRRTRRRSGPTCARTTATLRPSASTSAVSTCVRSSSLASGVAGAAEPVHRPLREASRQRAPGAAAAERRRRRSRRVPRTPAGRGRSTSRASDSSGPVRGARAKPVGARLPGARATSADVVTEPARDEADPVGGPCAAHTGPAGAGVATYDSGSLAGDITMIGQTRVTASVQGAAAGLQLNARLYDLSRTGRRSWSIAECARSPTAPAPSSSTSTGTHGDSSRAIACGSSSPRTTTPT